MALPDHAIDTNEPPFTILLIDSATGAEVERTLDDLLREFKENNVLSEARGDKFSRTCRGCIAQDPLQRFACTTCCWAVCGECAGKAECPVCKAQADFVKLYENAQFSRDCGICLTEAPHERVFLSPCGHTLCRSCGIKMIADAISTQVIVCPFCRADSGIYYLKEETVKNN